MTDFLAPETYTQYGTCRLLQRLYLCLVHTVTNWAVLSGVVDRDSFWFVTNR